MDKAMVGHISSDVAVDFKRMNGINSIFIANQVINSQVKTVLSLDEGLNWQLIPGPELDFNGQPYDCRNMTVSPV
jgi:hypothetical protein